ncbi:hypothetical protein GGI04_000114 [Coemansia thaxteri]|uniref:Fungal lipase-type domain-containing protein n=1 Tax=Coemansia thaxteri TaxID=2663907 RepID=A0A9W8ED58_9FUNG|nr:hypothetical protein H4R26_004888 [Coemansia thaxteri]KAJ2009798.1 hypothetical protein GGI04_000114 [Coemansia thaxteri]KAJ2480676.1 hypothetical protein EV174_003660 [Coemansia sp. RSA 2320]
MLRAGRFIGLLVWTLAAGLALAYRDVELVPGRRYQAHEVGPVHELVRKYMRYSTAASSFVELDKGWASCGLACNSPDVRDVMLNLTWHVDAPLSDGLIGIHKRDKEIVVAWAGTHRYRALITDVSVFTMPYAANEGSVHGGFLDSVRGVVGVVEQHLRRLMADYPDYMVVFTGHSKGGAEAALGALDLARRVDGLRQRMRVWTFGEPRLGDTQFASVYNKVLGPVTYRVTSAADPVVAMPPRFLLDYCHHNLEIWLSSADGNMYVARNYTKCDEDPLASSSVDFYDRSIIWHKNYLGLPPPDHADAEFSW